MNLSALPFLADYITEVHTHARAFVTLFLFGQETTICIKEEGHISQVKVSSLLKQKHIFYLAVLRYSAYCLFGSTAPPPTPPDST